ncbi:MAG TPA: endonuclease, partial [Segetibacter sp.]
TGLSVNTTYYFFVFAANGVNCTSGPLYNTTAATGSATTTTNTSGIPPAYYSTTTNKSCADLKTELKTIISTGHAPKTYGDLWGQYEVSDIKPREVGPGTSTTVIWDVYSDKPTGTDPYNFTPGPISSGGQQDNGTNTSTEGQFYNREHSVPLSWFGGNTGNPGPATDYLHIFPTDKVVNAIRSNYIYGEVATASYVSGNGSKLGSSAIAGFNGDVFEPINEYKGDLARAFLYFVTRYQDNMASFPGANGIQAFEPNTYPSIDVPYLQLMLKWNNQDPVSQKEIDRNNAAYSYQGNRNPYIDSPQYVIRVWNSNCTGLAALPVNIVYFAGKILGGQVNLEWKVENEIRFERYEIERSINGTDFKKIGEVKAANSNNYGFSENAETFRSQRVYYRLKSIDKDGTFKYSNVWSAHIPLNTKFTVYPNPASNYIQLQLNKNVSGKVTLELTDALGKAVKQVNENVTGSNIKIATNELSAGNYILKMLYNGEQYTQKVIVIK